MEAAATHIWDNNSAGLTGIMTSESMQPEVKDCWERFRRGDIGLDAVKRVGHIALPMLRKRLRASIQPPSPFTRDAHPR